MPDWFELCVGLEAAASRLRQYEPELIPGLLQTPAYTVEVIATDHADMSDEDRQRRADIKAQRQQLLTRKVQPAPEFTFIINEAALRRPLPDRMDMGQQLRRLVDAAALPNISIRVLPLSAGIHRAAMAGAFVILDFPRIRDRDPEPSTVYSENVTGALYLDKDGEVSVYESVWNAAVEKSLGADESREVISEIAKEHHP